MRVSGRFLFGLAVALVAGWALLETRDWPIKAALYPRAVTIPLLLLAVAESLLSLKGAAEPEAAQATDVSLTSSTTPEQDTRRTVTMVAWIAGLLLGVILVGFQAAVPLFVLAYLRAQGKERWVVSVVLAIAAGGVFHLLFVRLLHLPLPVGLIVRVFTR